MYIVLRTLLLRNLNAKRPKEETMEEAILELIYLICESTID